MQASAKLKQAESASSSAERDSLTAEAVASLRLVPLSCNLAYLVSQLVYLNNYEVRMWFYRLGYHGQRCDCCGVCS